MSEGSFEATVSGRRESANGIFITLQVNPADLTTDLAMLRVGSALMVGWSQVLDTAVHKIEPVPMSTGEMIALIDNKPKARTLFKDLKLSQQAGIRSGDATFAMHLMDEYPVTAAKYHEAADVVRELCSVKSRAELDTNDDAAEAWKVIEFGYQNWLTDKKYKDSYR